MKKKIKNFLACACLVLLAWFFVPFVYHQVVFPKLIVPIRFSSYVRQSMDMQADWLIRNQKPGGDFVYGRNISDASEISGYNIVREAGGMYALAQYYNLTHREDVKQSLEKGFAFFDSQLVPQKADWSLAVEYKGKVLSNTSALLLLSMIEYAEANPVQDEKFVAKMHALAKYLVSTQKENGGFINELPDTESSYNDGESLYALSRMYLFSKKPVYLEAAKKAATRMQEKYGKEPLNESFYSWGMQGFYYLNKAEPQDQYWAFMNDYTKKFMESSYYQEPKAYFFEESEDAADWMTAVYMEGLFHVASLAREKDPFLAKELDAFLTHGVKYFMELQYNHPLSQRTHENALLVGSICAYSNCTECQTTRVDVVQHTLSAMYWSLAFSK